MKPTTATPTRGLPGQWELDESLVRTAIGALQRHAGQAGLQDRLRVAEIILRHFFDGRPELLHAHGRRHVSYQALVKSSGSGLSASAIWYAVSMYEQVQRLPPNLAQALPVSHHRILLHVRDPIAKQRLAQRARDEQLSKRELEELARKCAPPPSSGRLGQTRARQLRRIHAALEELEAFTLEPEDLCSLSANQVTLVIRELQPTLQRVEALAEDLRRASRLLEEMGVSDESKAAK